MCNDSYVLCSNLWQIVVYIGYFKALIIPSISVITDKCMVIIETLPVNSKFLMSNLPSVIFHLKTPCSQCLCCNHIFLFEIPVLWKNNDVLQQLMAGSVGKHKRTQCFQSHQNIWLCSRVKLAFNIAYC